MEQSREKTKTINSNIETNKTKTQSQKRQKRQKDEEKTDDVQLLKQAVSVSEEIDPLFRLRLTKHFDQIAKKCDFNYLHNMKPLQNKNSVSDTVIIFSDFKAARSGQTVMKVSYKKNKYLKHDNSLEIERMIYKHVANNIVLNNWSPHVLVYVGSFSCPLSSFSKIFQNKIKNDLNDVDRTGIIDFLLTERAKPDSKTLKSLVGFDNSDIAHKMSFSLEKLNSIVFQILFTLEVFNRIGFMHNDLHLENIFIEEWSELPEKLGYIVNGKKYMIPVTHNFVKIYDFDRSVLKCEGNKLPFIKDYIKDVAKIGKCHNTRLDSFLCSDYSQCNRFNPKLDTYKVLKSIFDEIYESRKEMTIFGNSPFNKWFQQTLIPLSKEMWSYIGNVPANAVDEDFYFLKRDLSDEEMPSTMDILINFTETHFQGYEVDPKDDGVFYNIP